MHCNVFNCKRTTSIRKTEVTRLELVLFHVCHMPNDKLKLIIEYDNLCTSVNRDWVYADQLNIVFSV